MLSLLRLEEEEDAAAAALLAPAPERPRFSAGPDAPPPQLPPPLLPPSALAPPARARFVFFLGGLAAGLEPKPKLWKIKL